MKSAEIRLFLRTGTVFKKQHNQLHSELPHYFIVLNHNPHLGECLVLAVISSKVEKVVRRVQLQGFPTNTYVLIPRANYNPLTEDSIVNCNDVLTLRSEDLLKYKAADFRDDLPSPVLERIIQGVIESPKVSTVLKKLIRQDSDNPKLS